MNCEKYNNDKMKREIRILLVILIILIVFAGITTFTYTAHKDTTVLGENTNGTVYKITYGNDHPMKLQ